MPEMCGTVSPGKVPCNRVKELDIRMTVSALFGAQNIFYHLPQAWIALELLCLSVGAKSGVKSCESHLPPHGNAQNRQPLICIAGLVKHYSI